ncbi:MAG: hypothetical protein AB1894_15235 [Chloroflexota bacterium]
MKISLNRIASVLAFIIGAMAIFAGGSVLLGRDPGYYVINWLPLFNYTIGILTFLFVAILIWINSRLALPSAIAVFSLQGLVMIILLAGYGDVVAPDSIVATTVRIVVWLIILSLLFLQQKKNQPA